MKVSLNWIKKYVDLPNNLTPKQIAYDLTIKTVEVESIENTKDKYHDIVVGQIKELNKHPDADKLMVCMVDIGNKLVQIVCGGSNLYVGEYVVVSLPGAEVFWHGEGELVKIKETKMRGVESYGMICGASEVYLSELFPPKDDHEIVDLDGYDVKPGDNICDALGLDDTIIDIDNKSLTNRPDLWGHLGIAREIATIYDIPLKEIPKTSIPSNIPKYNVEIQNTDKCMRYVGIEVDNVYVKESPFWMKKLILNAGMRPINALVDITNYVMLSTGQPMHAFDKTHIIGNKIIVRDAKKDEKLILLDNNVVELNTDDLVICDTAKPLGLAGIKGGRDDSILNDTTSVLIEIANFKASTIRKSSKRFDEKTDSSIRYEKNIDTERIDSALALTISLLKELYPDSKIISYTDNYPHKTERSKIDISKEFLSVRLGTYLSVEKITRILTSLGYDVNYKDEVFHVVAPVWRSTGDVTIKDDVLGDIARIVGYDNFEAKPLTISIDHAVRQVDVSLERNLREFLAYRCGFNEIYTYPWIDIKYIEAAKIDTNKLVRLATPPSPQQANLRGSLIPGMLEAITKNLRYLDNFKMFELAQVFEKGEYHESCEEETLPIHKKYLTGVVVDKDPKKAFYEIKGVVESMSKYVHMEELSFSHNEKPSWADINGYLNIMLNDKEIGSLGLLSVSSMNAAKIKRTNVAIFELNVDELIPYTSRTNKYIPLPVLPLVSKDLSILVNNDITWNDIHSSIKSKVKDIEFIEEYHGNQIPDGKKSITLRVKIGNDDKTLTNEEITNEMNKIIKTLNNRCGATIREE